ncbi:PspC domain-containing protein [Flammeovirga sp. EKP202]|uniref:PspC domain-containing protein n=1 Tax=Flammeovirga sp. EKP202 TaxID=2770592 RepID=UPI00165F9B52|nr:PspC domain-containing protein [Flammeovirga sp. EKP202]MBD0401280.1 PspC domain-containing protein [Flammeovirga sp. EKP202]
MIHNNVHIGNNVFKITGDAKSLLDSYRSALYEHLKNFNNSEIIIKEIEYKLAELLLPYIESEFDFLKEDDVKQAILIIGLPDGYTIPDLQKESETQSQSIYNETVSTLSQKFKNLYRDIDRQQIGGVAAGIADSLKIDPLWIRLLLILPLFILGTTKGPLLTISIAYLVGWLLLPEKRNIQRDENVRIFFRDKEKKIFGGVAAGLSNYLGIDINWIRLGLIFCTYFFNELILIYAIIWTVTPYSRSLKDKFQSKGVQFNLTEIEAYLTKTFENTNFSGEYFNSIYQKIENTNFKVNASPLLYKLLRGFCFLVGAVLFITTITMVFTAIPILGISLKIIPLYSIFDYISEDIANEVLFEYDHNLLNTIQYSIPNTTAIISALQFTVFTILLFVISTSLITFKKNVNNSFLFGLITSNIVFTILLLTALNMSVHNFDNQATHKEEVMLPLNAMPLELKMERLGNIPLNETKVYINGYDGDKLKLVFLQEALGKTRERAIINAKAIDYTSKVEANSITLGSHFSFPRGVKYRMQSMQLFIYVPHGKEFTIDDKIKEKIKEQDIEFKHYEKNRFLIFDTDDICHTFDKEDIYDIQNNIKFSRRKNKQLKHLDASLSSNKKKLQIKISPTDSLEIYGNFKVDIDFDEDIDFTNININSDQYLVKTINKTLKIYPLDELNNDDEHTLKISSPKDIAFIKFNGKGDLDLAKCNVDTVKLELNGNIEANVDIESEFLYTTLIGSSNLTLNGKSQKAFIFANDGSQIEGKDFITQEVKAKAKGVSKIEITAEQNATIFQTPLSKVTILGDPVHFEKHTQR